MGLARCGGTLATAMHRGEDGQILPGLLTVLLALLAVGVLTFQVGKAAVLRSEAQTAADAAALAGAQEIRRQLSAQWASSGTTDLSLLDQRLVRAEMDDYARLNGGRVVAREIDGVDVKATAVTLESLGEDAREIGEQDETGHAKARARVSLLASGVGGLGGGGNLGPLPTGAPPKIPERAWKALAERLGSGPPDCGGVVTLGRFLVSHGFQVGENRHFGGIQAQHTAGGWHYRCDGAGALDVNFGAGGDLVPAEVAAIDPIIAPLRRLGFRTIWRAPDHNDHLHVDIANSGPIGAGGGSMGGFAGPLEDAILEVKLIDYEAPDAAFLGLGGGAGGFFAGPPDPRAAQAICTVARSMRASGKVVLAAYEAAIVESGVHSLPYGDRDSLGLVPAARVVGLCRPAHEPGVRGAAVRLAGAARPAAVHERRPARAGRAAIRLPPALRPAARAGDGVDREPLLAMRRAPLLLALALAAGCGEDERAAAPAVPQADYGPATAQPGTAPRPEAPERRAPARSVARALAGGEVGVVGAEGEVGVRPRRLEVSADGALEDVRWRSWDGQAAVGAGRLRLLDCDPTCATGGTELVAATIRLSRPRTCGRERYFDRAELTSEAGLDPASYVRAPC